MKVLYISHSVQLYGAPKSLLEYVSKMKEKGIEPIVIVPENGDLNLELDKRGVPNRIIPYCSCIYKSRYSKAQYMEYVWTNFKAVLKISKLLKKEQIDIVHTNTLAVDVGALAAFISKVPHVWHFREYVEEDADYKRLHPGITRELVRRSKGCIAVSEGIKRKYRKKYGVNSIRLYDGVEINAYLNPINENFCTENVAELLLAGTICEGKGQWDAIKAVEILVSRGIDIHLNIVGSGTTTFVGDLREYVRKRGLMKYVTFRSYTHHLQKLRVQSRIVLVCSRMEAFGRVTAEAMMAGKIVIGSNSGGTLEMIGQHEERGYLYQFGRPDELADKIQYALMNEREVFEKEKIAQRFIIELTDMEKYTDKLIRLYRKWTDA